jgi:hypothetical protein
MAKNALRQVIIAGDLKKYRSVFSRFVFNNKLYKQEKLKNKKLAKKYFSHLQKK